jgi:hypothetical protein
MRGRNSLSIPIASAYLFVDSRFAYRYERSSFSFASIPSKGLLLASG